MQTTFIKSRSIFNMNVLPFIKIETLFLMAIAFFFASCVKNHDHPCADDASVIKVKVIATGLNNPRGLKFGPDGNLYVAEGGVGGTQSSTGCDQVIPPIGPYTGSATGGRISKISWNGERTTIVDNLPTSQTSAESGALVSGVADVAFVGRNLYAILAGAGCSHGVSSLPNGIVKIKGYNSWTVIADLSAWQQSHPVLHPEEDDFEPDGTWYNMVSVNGNFFALEPNHGELVKVNVGGKISRVVDISASEGHNVPSALAYDRGSFYVGNLNPFPIIDGSSHIYKITPGGEISIVLSDFTTVLGIAFDEWHRMYVLENTTGNLFPTPGTGKIIRVNNSGTRDVIATGLNLPTGITFGPDGKLYVSNWGFGPPAIGGGQILQITVKNCEGDDLPSATMSMKN